jgi:broad specificity phosphatase PhoE
MPLTERGVAQARRLADRLRHEAIAAVYTSDLGRARRTAGIVAEPHGVEPIPHAGLREIDTGRWTGLLHSEARDTAKRAALTERSRGRRSERPFPEGEARTDVQRRTLAALDERSARHTGESIVVISHRVTITTILAHALALSLESTLPGQDAHCSSSVLDVSPGARYVHVHDRP